MKLRIRSAWLSSRPVEFRLSKMSCGLSCVSVEGDVDDHELGETRAESFELCLAFGYLSQEELKVLPHPDRVVARQRVLVQQGDQRGLVRLRQDQLVPALPVFQRIEQVVVPQLLRREPLDRLGSTDAPSQGLDEQGHRRQALLTVDHQER